MMEELAVGAQFNLPFVHVLVNNAYLGLIRQSQRGFDMDYCVQLSFENVNTHDASGYGDDVRVAEASAARRFACSSPGDPAGPARGKAHGRTSGPGRGRGSSSNG